MTTPKGCPACGAAQPGRHFHIRLGATLPAEFTHCPHDTDRSHLMTLAQVNTGHFDFLAVGKDDADALAALEQGWRKHCRQYPDADPGLLHEIRDEIRLTTVEVGDVLRDGDRLI